MRYFALFFICFLAVRPAVSEPSFGSLIGIENDFLRFECRQPENGFINCDFKQISMSLKVKPENVEAEIAKRLAYFADGLDADPETMADFTESCPVMQAISTAMEMVLSGEIEKAKEAIAELPTEQQSGFDMEAMQKGMAKNDPRENKYLLDAMMHARNVCENQDLLSFAGMVRHEVEKEARTCKLFINEWSDSFQRISDERWVIENSGPSGECGIVRLDRFECRDSLCDYISEKRVLNQEGEAPSSLLSCSDFEEGEFRYEHDSDGVYLQCDIMSFF